MVCSYRMTKSSSPSPAYTFVVRFRREWSAARPRWRGSIENVQSGERAAFLDLEGMLEFLRGLGVMSEDEILPAREEE